MLDACGGIFAYCGAYEIIAKLYRLCKKTTKSNTELQNYFPFGKCHINSKGQDLQLPSEALSYPTALISCFSLKGYGFSQEDLKDNNKAILLYHRLIEAMKFGFAQYSKLGDPDFVDEEGIKKVRNAILMYKD